MRFMIIVKATRDSEAGVMPGEELLAEMLGFHEELARAGVLLDGSGLQPSAKGWRIRYNSGQRAFVDGPFAETKEQLTGFYMIEAKDLDEAIHLAAKIPPGRLGSIEVRPVRPIRETVARQRSQPLRKPERSAS
ncbi:MAG: YciI family protein [Burkholderiales bacterium]